MGEMAQVVGTTWKSMSPEENVPYHIARHFDVFQTVMNGR